MVSGDTWWLYTGPSSQIAGTSAQQKLAPLVLSLPLAHLSVCRRLHGHPLGRGNNQRRERSGLDLQTRPAPAAHGPQGSAYWHIPTPASASQLPVLSSTSTECSVPLGGASLPPWPAHVCSGSPPGTNQMPLWLVLHCS